MLPTTPTRRAATLTGRATPTTRAMLDARGVLSTLATITALTTLSLAAALAASAAPGHATATATAAAATQDAGPSRVVVHAGTLLAVPGQAPKLRQTLVIENGRILEVRAGFVAPAAVGAPADALVDLSDRFVLPGLVDLHVHLLSELGPSSRLSTVTETSSDATLDGVVFLRRTLDAGFTTVRDLGSDPEAIFALRAAVAAGKIPGPRIVAAGGGVVVTGGHGDVHGFREDVLEVFRDNRICDGADDCRRAVRAQVKRGSDLIKIAATGGVLSETASGVGVQMFDDELEAIVATAHRLGRRVAAHAHGADGINAALRAGVDSIEHGTYADDESIRLFKQTGAYLVPTVLAGWTVKEMAEASDFMPAPIREKALAVGPQIQGTVRRLHAAGVAIAFGTDTGVSPHGQNAKEFELLVEAGLTPAEAITTATANAARLLDLESEIGSLEPGKQADLIATDGSPLDDVSQLRRVVFVMRAGRVHKR